MGKRRHRWLRAGALLVACALMLVVAANASLAPAREKRQRYGYGSNVAWGVARASVEQLLTPAKDPRSIASASGGLISDHDLFMLVEAARFRIGRDEDLSAAFAAGRLPVLYTYLDGYDHDRVVLRKSLVDDLPAMEPGDWVVAPALLGLPASPSVRDVAAEVTDDDPLLSLHTCGQVLRRDVGERGIRYRLGSVTESPQKRAAQIREVRRRVQQLEDAVQVRVGAQADNAAYVRAAFDEIVRTITYAENSTSAHDNDVYGALVEGSARCYGLSGVLKLLLDARGIPNYLADGTKPTGRHTWNVVWTGGAWRVCDLTLMLDREEGNACLVLAHNFYAEHHYVPDDECRILELVYSKLVS